MKRATDCAFILAVSLLLLNGCFDFLTPNVTNEKWMTFTAEFATDSSRYSRIVLADYDDLQNYRFITSAEDEAGISYISPDKKKAIILTRSGWVHNCDIFLYNIETDSLIELYDPQASPIDSILFGTYPIIWDLDSEGFYYRVGSSWVTLYKHYDLNNNTITTAPGIIQDIKEEDSLFVFSYDEEIEEYGIFTIGKDGGQQFKVNNPYLNRVKLNDRIVQSAYGLDWNENTRQFVFAFNDTTSSNPRITITDYRGRKKCEYTSLHDDSDPVWGPDDTIIFFDRSDSSYQSLTHVLNIKTGSIMMLSELVNIEGASRLSWASY